MYYVYVLVCVEGKFYIGFTSNLEKRFLKHKQGRVFATKSRLPIELIFYEAYKNKYDALRREKYLKTTKGRTTLRSMLREYLANIK